MIERVLKLDISTDFHWCRKKDISLECICQIECNITFIAEEKKITIKNEEVKILKNNSLYVLDMPKVTQLLNQHNFISSSWHFWGLFCILLGKSLWLV